MEKISGKAKGGRARAEKLTPEQRSEIAKKAGEARWREPSSGIVKATHIGQLKLGDIEVQCAVLEDGTRVLTASSIFSAFGRTRKGMNSRLQIEGTNIPPFLASKNLEQYINQDVTERTKLISYAHGRSVKTGYDASLLPKMCEVYLSARRDGVLTASQAKLALQAEMLLSALAQVGVVALVDEATGYQYDREKDALVKILEAYLSEERLRWAKMFPDEFYKQMYRLMNWGWPSGVGKPAYVGKLTNELVYTRLPAGVLEELRKRNPVIPEKKRRAYVFTQFLSEDFGQPDLKNHLLQTIVLMKVAKSWDHLISLMDEVFPKGGKAQMPLPMK